jgi:putative membrane protein (TIGR04086 family)
MEHSLKDIKWGKIILSSVSIYIISFIAITIIITIYAFILGVEVRGEPDQNEINNFASSISNWLIPLIEILLIFLSTSLLFKKEKNNILIYGLLLGVFVGLLNIITTLFFSNQFEYSDLFILFILSICGYFGGLILERFIVKKGKTA